MVLFIYAHFPANPHPESALLDMTRLLSKINWHVLLYFRF